jgi:hypothetical protein
LEQRIVVIIPIALKAWKSPSDPLQEKEIFSLPEHSDRLEIPHNLPFHG